MITLLVLFSALALTAWSVYACQRSFKTPGSRGAQKRALWAGVALLAVSQVLYGSALRHLLDDNLGVGWAKALAELAVILASGFVLQLLHRLLSRPERVHRRVHRLTAVAAVVSIGPFLLIPPRTAHLFEPSLSAVAHWAGVLPLLSWALACACTVWPRHAHTASTAAVRTGMWLITIGSAIGLLWVLACALALLAAFTVDAAAFSGAERLEEVLSASSKSIIVVGVAWPALARWSARALQLVQDRTINGQLRQLRPFWAELAAAAPSKVHFLAATGSEPHTSEEADFQRTRMITEIQDICRLAGAYVSVQDFHRAHAAAAARLPTAKAGDASVVAAHVCLRLGLQRWRARRPRSTNPAPELHVEGETVALAAGTFLQELRIVGEHRVLLQSLTEQLDVEEGSRS